MSGIRLQAGRYVTTYHDDTVCHTARRKGGGGRYILKRSRALLGLPLSAFRHGSKAVSPLIFRNC